MFHGYYTTSSCSTYFCLLTAMLLLSSKGLSIDEAMTGLMGNIKTNLAGLLEKTRHALNDGHSLGHVMPIVFQGTVQILGVNQSYTEAAVAATAYLYSRLPPSSVHNVVGRGASLSSALKGTTNGPTDESFTSLATHVQGKRATGSFRPFSPAAAVSASDARGAGGQRQ